MLKKLSIILAVLVILSMVLGACTPPPPATEAPKKEEPKKEEPKQAEPTKEAPKKSGDCSSPDVLCVGLVTDVGKIDDKSFNQSTWEGVKQAEKDLGATVKYVETTDSKDYAKNIASFADEKYDVIVTVGFALGEASIAAAKEFPNIKFIGVDQFQGEAVPNLAGLIFNEDQAGYLAGVLAASMSKSKKLGAVLGTDAVPPVWRFGEGYRAGAKAVDSAIELNVVYHNDVGFDKTFSDPEWGKTTAISMIDKGVDVLFGAGGKTGNGALLGCAEKNVMAIGVDTDQYLTVPEAQKVLLSSAMKLLTPGTFNLIKLAKEGKFPGGNFSGEVGLAPFHDLDGKVPADLKAKIEQTRKGLIDGSIKTNVPPAKPAEAPKKTGDCSSPDVLCVGLVTDVGKIDDKSFNQSTWEGVKQAEKDLGATVKYVETTDSKDYAKNIASFADEKYDVIVTVGFALGEASIAAAKEFPNIKFIGVDQFQGEAVPNLAGLIFNEDQAGYLAGVLAASMSKSKKLGAVLGTDAVPPVWRFGEGYRAGAKAVDSAIELNVVYHNDVGFDKTFSDPEWGKTTAISMIDKGVDVLFGAGGKTGNGALLGCAEKNVMAIGVDTDQYLTVPEAQKVLLSSAMKLLTPGTFNLIKLAKEGKFPGGNFSGEVGLAPFHDLDGKVPADLKAKIEQTRKGLIDGSIKTNVPPAKPK